MIKWIRQLFAKKDEPPKSRTQAEEALGTPGMHVPDRNEIEVWFETGVAKGATHLIVVCDTFDYDGYPVYFSPTEDVREVFEHYNGKNMQKVVEVYKLSMDRATQLAEHRAFNF